MTPLGATHVPEEQRYNSSHVRTRAIIERTFGLMKMRFRCMDGSGGVILSQPDRACEIIMAVACLHNIAERRNLPIINDGYQAPNNAVQQPEAVRPNENPIQQAAEIRRAVIQTFM